MANFPPKMPMMKISTSFPHGMDASAWMIHIISALDVICC